MKQHTNLLSDINNSVYTIQIIVISLAGQGQYRAWQGMAGQGRAGQGRAGQGRAGQSIIKSYRRLWLSTVP